MADTRLKTRIILRNDTTAGWTAVEATVVLLKGEVGIEFDTVNNKTKMKIGDGTSKWSELDYFGSSDEYTTTLRDDLYAYTNIGKISASKTNPVKVADAGDPLKDVFNSILGVQEDTQPTISTTGTKVTEVMTGHSQGTANSTEYGTAIAASTGTFQITLANSETSNYGYRVGTNKYTGTQTFYYPVQKQTTGSNTYDVAITLPSGKTSGDITMVTGTLVDSADNVLYCNFSNKVVKISFNLASGSVTTSDQTLFNKISYLIKFDAARKTENDSSTAVTAFLTYLGNDATDQSKLSHAQISGESDSVWKINKGTYYPYYWTSTTTTPTDPISGDALKKSTTTECTSTGIKPNPSENSHIWFLFQNETATKMIEYEALGQWYDFGPTDPKTVGPTNVNITLKSGATVAYKAYYTTAKGTPGDTLYRIKNV